MVQINFARREVNCKIVYYGPGLSGKTTNLEKVHELAPKGATGDLTSISTDGERTLFFDFLPFDLGEIAGMRVKLQLYTVPGQGYYDRVRRLVLQGADGVVFVADSMPERQDDNVDSLKNLEENLQIYKVELKDLPHVMQWNKRDKPGAMGLEQMESTLNPYKAPSFEGVAFKGDGVLATLKAISKQVIEKLHRDFEQQAQARASSQVAPVPGIRPASAVPAAEAVAPVPVPPLAPPVAAAPVAPPVVAAAAVAQLPAETRKTPRSALPAVMNPPGSGPTRVSVGYSDPLPPPPGPANITPPLKAGPVWTGGADAPAPAEGRGALLLVAIIGVIVLAAAIVVIKYMS